ncbi:hypothetical protein ACFRCG_03655 [Embleya sp. NPDC056575]|uniref:hypothetical protein n=1 Tax=unclassified Embleya TaxID=2699296 RepID=UPI0036CAC460
MNHAPGVDLDVVGAELPENAEVSSSGGEVEGADAAGEHLAEIRHCKTRVDAQPPSPL